MQTVLKRKNIHFGKFRFILDFLVKLYFFYHYESIDMHIEKIMKKNGFCCAGGQNFVGFFCDTFPKLKYFVLPVCTDLGCRWFSFSSRIQSQTQTGLQTQNLGFCFIFYVFNRSIDSRYSRWNFYVVSTKKGMQV